MSSMVDSKYKISLWVIVGVAFVEAVSFSMLIPLIPFYGRSLGASDLGIGFLLASYNIAQAVCAPLIGGLGDRFGRRPVLLWSLIGTSLSFLIWAKATAISDWLAPGSAGVALGVLFFSRALDGVTGSNIGIANAYLADITNAENRSRAMGLTVAAFGLAMMIAPPISGYLSRHGDYAISAWVGFVLSLLNAIGVYFFLLESRAEKSFDSQEPKAPKRNPVESIASGFSLPRLRPWLITIIMYWLAFGMWTSTFTLFLEKKYDVSSEMSGYLLGFAGFVIVLVQTQFISRLTQKYKEYLLVVPLLIGLSVTCFYWSWTPTLASYVIGVIPFTLAGSTLGVVLRALVSLNVSHQEVGEYMGVATACESVTKALAPLAGASLIYYVGLYAPGVVAGILLVFWVVWLKTQKVLEFFETKEAPEVYYEEELEPNPYPETEI